MRFNVTTRIGEWANEPIWLLPLRQCIAFAVHILSGSFDYEYMETYRITFHPYSLFFISQQITEIWMGFWSV